MDYVGGRANAARVRWERTFKRKTCQGCLYVRKHKLVYTI